MKKGMPHYADRQPRDISLELVKRCVPLGREQVPEDIGHLAVFLCGNNARNNSGQAIAVDGGITRQVGN